MIICSTDMTHLRSLRYSDKILCDISISEGDKVGDVGPPSQVCRAPARWWGAGHHHGLLRAPLGYLRAPFRVLKSPLRVFKSPLLVFKSPNKTFSISIN